MRALARVGIRSRSAMSVDAATSCSARQAQTFRVTATVGVSVTVEHGGSRARTTPRGTEVHLSAASWTVYDVNLVTTCILPAIRDFVRVTNSTASYALVSSSFEFLLPPSPQRFRARLDPVHKAAETVTRHQAGPVSRRRGEASAGVQEPHPEHLEGQADAIPGLIMKSLACEAGYFTDKLRRRLQDHPPPLKTCLGDLSSLTAARRPPDATLMDRTRTIQVE
ncbi:hypothetical protein LY76DRAFT_161760 [Colletotrichum caudatum]|nr:hypothetical protein LY76DRAFT_161760 [Colletotrichum caudatum]